MSHKQEGQPHGWWLSICSRQGDEMSGAIATEAQQIVRAAAGSAGGLIVKGQIQQAARNLGYPVDSWRIREAWYGRAGGWSAQAIRDLQDAYLKWRDRERSRRSEQDAADRALLEQTRARYLADLAAIEARLATYSSPGSAGPA